MKAHRYNSLKFRLLVADALRVAKRYYSYRELARRLGIPESMLSRYVMGRTVPSLDQARRILSSLQRIVDLERLVLDRIRELHGLIDLTPILTDPLLLRMISIHFYTVFEDERITRILVPETSGISLATAISMVFEAPMTIARRMKDNPYEDYLEAAFVEPPSGFSVFYIPSHSMSKRDSVLIVDDIVQTGRTLHVMERFVSRVGARLAGVAALVVVGDEWRRRVSRDVRVESIVRLAKP